MPSPSRADLRARAARLRDHLVLLLRKAMFSREEPTRLTAVHGFLQLLHTTGRVGAAAADGAMDVDSGDELPVAIEVASSYHRSAAQHAADPFKSQFISKEARELQGVEDFPSPPKRSASLSFG